MTRSFERSGAWISALRLIGPDWGQGVAFYRDGMGFRLIEDSDQGR